MGKITYTVIELNKPSAKAIEDFNRIAYSFIKKEIDRDRDKKNLTKKAAINE
jgi:hypothetical protein